ncbi:MAG: dihydrofolate reductase [Gammaproteobacteria bacterium]|nr:dihydrofolate reductase [Gammaproteobacteria bacterium]
MNKPVISIIAAIARNGVIGRDNDLPWHLPADLAFFKKTTNGHPIILGRKNYESIGRPLPNRTNIIVTRDTSYTADGCLVAHNLDDAISLACRNEQDEIFIIGGAQVYAQALPLVSRMYLTRVHTDAIGDVFFPDFDCNDWTETWRDNHQADDRNGFDFTFVKLERKSRGRS